MRFHFSNLLCDFSHFSKFQCREDYKTIVHVPFWFCHNYPQKRDFGSIHVFLIAKAKFRKNGLVLSSISHFASTKSKAPHAAPNSRIARIPLYAHIYSCMMIDDASISKCDPTISKCDHRITSIHRMIFNYSAECIITFVLIDKYCTRLYCCNQVIRLQICTIAPCTRVIKNYNSASSNNYSRKFYK